MTLAILAAAIADLCANLPQPASEPDSIDAAEYVAVGDASKASGDIRIAAIAYRDALALDPGNARAKDALAELCRDAAPDDAPALRDAIARYRRGDLDGARAELAPIAAGRGPEAASAQFFLGLVELQDHDGTAAARDLMAASRDPAYAELATAMLRLARREGPLTVGLVVAPELDTNPALVPDTPPVGATTGSRQTDEDLLLGATVTARPLRWLAIRDVLAWRKQATLTQLDFLAETAQLAAELDGGRGHIQIRYDLDYDLLAARSYLLAHRVTFAARHDLDRFSVVANYALRRRDYQMTAQAPFTGWVHTGELGVILHATPALDIDVRVIATRELAADPVFADVALGGQVGLRTRVTGSVRGVATATAWYARYDAPEPDGQLRQDTHGEGAADVEVDLADHVIAIAGAALAVNASTIEDFRYWKVTARCGLAFAFGGP